MVTVIGFPFVLEFDNWSCWTEPSFQFPLPLTHWASCKTHQAHAEPHIICIYSFTTCQCYLQHNSSFSCHFHYPSISIKCDLQWLLQAMEFNKQLNMWQVAPKSTIQSFIQLLDLADIMWFTINLMQSLSELLLSLCLASSLFAFSLLLVSFWSMLN